MTQKLPQPQIPRKGNPDPVRHVRAYDLGHIRAHGKLWHYEYSTTKLSVARGVKTRTERGYPGSKAIIRKYYDGFTPMYFVFARWKKL